jgi:hypothetical protein
VDVQWILQFFGQRFDLESFFDDHVLEVVDFLPKVWNLSGLRLNDSEFTLVVANLKLKQSNVLQSFLILDLASGQLALKDLNLFVKKSQFIISSNKLGSKDVSLVNRILVGFLESFVFIISISDDIVQFLNLVFELLSFSLNMLLFFCDLTKQAHYDIFLLFKLSFIKTDLGNS